MDKEAIKVCKLWHICVIIHKIWCLVCNNNNKKMILNNSHLTNTNRNIFGLTKKGKDKYKYAWFGEEKCKCKYEYLWVEKKGN